MNAIVFGVKRAFHGVLKATRKRLQAVSPGMTAARFDMLYLLAGGRDGRRKPESFYVWESFQGTLARELGVSEPVVARMLRSLEKLGWVVRRRWERDGRYRVVAITEAGLECVRRAFRRVVPFSRRLVLRAIGSGKRGTEATRSPRKAVEALDAELKSLRRECGDYPYWLWLLWWGRPNVWWRGPD